MKTTLNFPARATAPALCLSLLSGLMAALPAQAQSSVQTTEAILITGSRVPSQAWSLTSEVTVIDRDTLLRSEARSLVEVLAQAPGLQFSASGGLGSTSALFIRGLEARHVLLLVDGVRVGSATVNAPSLDNLPLDLIERIEIVRGPMSSLYGSNAMAGVVQVFTRRAAAGVSANVRLAAGSQDFGLASAGVGFAQGGLNLAAQVQHQQTRGISATNAAVPFGSFNADRDGFKQDAASLRLGWAFAPQWRLDALLLQSDGRVQLDDGPGADARAGLHNAVTSLQLGGAVTPAWHSQLALGRSTDRYDTLASASPWADLGAIETRQTQVAWENRLQLPLGQALLVLEQLRQTVSRPGAAFELSARDINALALGYSLQHGAHSLQASLRRDRNSQFGGHNTGALAYSLALDERWRVGGSLGRSFTAPSFNDLYYPGYSNPTLQPENGEHAELFAAWQQGPHRLRATVYEHQYELYISGGPAPVNIPQVKIQGATLAWQGQWRQSSGQTLSAQLSYDHLNARNRSLGSANFNKLLPRRAPQALKAGLNWQSGALQLGAALQAYAHRFDAPSNANRLGGYAVLDVHADWALAHEWTLGLRLKNLADKRYETALGYNQAGREGLLTLRWATP